MFADIVDVDMTEGATDAPLAPLPPLPPPALLAVSEPRTDKAAVLRRPGSMAAIPSPRCEPYLMGVDERWR